MDAALCERFNPEEFYGRFLAAGVRPDGRGLRDRRPARLERGAIQAARGSAAIRLGQSSAVAGVRAEIVEALPDSPARGQIVVSVDLPTMCSSLFRDRQRAQSSATFLSNAFAEILNNSSVLEPFQLDIRPGEICWLLRASVVVLNYDGNAFDACLLSILAALEDTQLPGLIEEKPPAGLGVAAPCRLAEAPEGAVAPFAEARRLQLKSRPLPVTFAQLPSGEWVLDPCSSEEGLGASVSLCLVDNKWLVYHQGGGASLDRFLGELMPAARAAAESLGALLDKASEA